MIGIFYFSKASPCFAMKLFCQVRYHVIGHTLDQYYRIMFHYVLTLQSIVADIKTSHICIFLICATTHSVAFAAFVVLLMSILSLGHLCGSGLIFAMVVATDLNVLAALFYCGTSYNVVSSLVLILAVGFSADYSVHITHAFLDSRESTSEGRARAASMGRSVLCGGFSTFLAVAFLPISSSYLFRVALFQSVALTVRRSLRFARMNVYFLCMLIRARHLGNRIIMFMLTHCTLWCLGILSFAGVVWPISWPCGASNFACSVDSNTQPVSLWRHGLINLNFSYYRVCIT